MTTTSTAMNERGSVEAPPAPSPPAGRTLGRWWGRVRAAVQHDPVLVTVLVGSFLVRWLFADRNSYWLDELYSVTIYGIWNDSAGAAVDQLARTSVHPPLYQFILYNWMEVFGDSERATRTLSNLYITLATLFLFLLMRAAFTRRVALASAVAFALMYAPLYYGMETRSYAQTIFLVTLSSYALLRVMRTGTARGWEPALRSPAAMLFIVANVGLLLTHYYNAFFWVAQGIIAGVFVLRERPLRAWTLSLGAVAAMYAIQGGLFALVWGRVLVDDFRRRGGDFPTEGGVRSPLELLDAVADPNLYHTLPTRLIQWAALAALAAMAVRVVMVLARREDSTAERQREWTVAYLLGWLLIPLFVVYLTFLVTGVARYSPRYWLFIMPPLAPLLVLAFDRAGRLAARAWQRLRRRHRPSAGWAAVAVAAALAVLVLPGTFAAADRTKADFRGTAGTIVDIIDSDPGSSYVVYPTAFRSTPILDYYLSRYSHDVRVTATIPLFEERRGENFSFERTADQIAASDFLIVTFTHRPITDYPITMERLTAAYEVHHWQIDRGGRGMVIFSVPGPD